VKAWLSRADVPFIVREVDTDDAAYDALMALGFRAVPITLVGDHAIRGYDSTALEAALEAWRGQTTLPQTRSE
jgi:glutaredoxin-like protein NrdH